MIVAITHAGDDHAAPVLEALRRAGVRAAPVDLADFPVRSSLALEYGTGRGDGGWALRGPEGPIRAADVTAVWWRRPRLVVADAALSAGHAEHAVRQSWEALAGLAASLRVRWVNDPWRNATASHKPLQLAAAERAGLAVPRTLVTNDPAVAGAFLARAEGHAVVHKPLHATTADWRPTRRLGAADRERLGDVRFAPVILQEYVPGVDVRVTVAGHRVFAATIDARETSSPEDFRPVFDEARVEACELPDGVAARLRVLLATLGVAYAAIDLRRREDGEYVFLEVNPSGQWLGIEARTGQPITEAVAALLCGE